MRILIESLGLGGAGRRPFSLISESYGFPEMESRKIKLKIFFLILSTNPANRIRTATFLSQD